MPLQPLLIGDELRVYCLAKDHPHPIVMPSEVQPMLPAPLPEKQQTWLEGRKSYRGLATMRCDRFVLLRAPLRGGDVVTWRGTSDLTPLAGRVVQLRINVRNADLYSFRVIP